MIIVNMQNKLYTLQLFSPPNDRSTASPRAAIAECQTCEFLRFRKAPRKIRTPGKVWPPSQESI